MTDQNAYVNAYLEHVMAMVHDQLNQIIQLKTQLKLTEFIIAQKDAVIVDLNNKFLSTENSEIEMNNLKERARIAEDSYHAMSNKVSHMETLQNQFNDTKRQIIEKDRELGLVKSQIEILSAEIQNLHTIIEEKNSQLKEAKAVMDALPKAKEPEETEVLKKKINKKKESATLELPAVVSIAETNDF